MTVPVEVGHNEIGDAENPDMFCPREMVDLFVKLGFPEPGPIPLMRLEHQIAQKLHVVSAPGSERAHGLVDLQIIVNNSNLDYSLLKATCVKLFEYRQAQAWPPAVVAGAGWASLYDAAKVGVSVCGGVDEAVDWVNGLIENIDLAAGDQG